jgi:hypothetical protein
VKEHVGETEFLSDPRYTLSICNVLAMIHRAELPVHKNSTLYIRHVPRRSSQTRTMSSAMPIRIPASCP